MRLRRWVGWLVACVVALQGVSAGAAIGRGPAHVHVVPAPAAVAALVLIDVRRSGFEVDAPAGAGGLARFFGHHHENVGRHFHAAGDASVIVSAADQRLDDASGEGSQALDLVVATFMAVLTSSLLWLVTAAMRHGKASHTAWEPSHGTVRRLDRPPRFR